MRESLTLRSNIEKQKILDALLSRRGDYENEYIFSYSGDHVCSYSGDRLISYSIVEGERRLEVFRTSRQNRIYQLITEIEKEALKVSMINKILTGESELKKYKIFLSKEDTDILLSSGIDKNVVRISKIAQQ